MIWKRGLSVAVVTVVLGLVSCTTTAPTVTLSGPPGPYFVNTPVILTAIGSPGSSAGLWTYSFSATPACGTFAPATIGPTNQTTVTTTFTPTTPTTGCILSVTLTTVSGRTATDSIARDVISGISPNRGWFYVKDGTFPTDSVIGLNGNPAGTDCTTVGGDECDDDDGASYTNFPPTGGGSSVNSVIAGHPLAGGDNLAVVRFFGGDIGAHDLYIHVTDDVGANESEPNNSVSTANPVPPLPVCSEVFSEASGGNPQKPGTPYSESVPPNAAPGNWVRHGEIGTPGDMDYYGPISLVAGETIVVWVDGTPNTVGGAHDHDTSSLDGVISLQDPADNNVLSNEIDGCFPTIDSVCAEAFSVQPGAGTYYIRVRGFGSETHAYTLTACKFGP